MMEVKQLRQERVSDRVSTWISGAVPYDDSWESAYLRFETRDEELAKFHKRLLLFGADAWPRDARVMELFCGRGSGLRALEAMGFTRLEGVDLSANLLSRYDGTARLCQGDCRSLHCEDKSRDIIVVHGGLHHLVNLPGDLEKVFSEVHRVLTDNGIFAFTEPWPTPFLRMVHAVCRTRAARKLWSKLDALEEMIEKERATYFQWLGCPDAIQRLAERYFVVSKKTIAWGKILLVGRKRPAPPAG